ncbi:MAG: hypothetical protein EOP45_11450 [Sphingobacteriaceae bacterium]|nr:MAG: hypothetical protein EOP45_11450 [Sphingobacteriaceae bacterium]
MKGFERKTLFFTSTIQMRFTLKQIASFSCFTLLVEAIPGFWNTGKAIDPPLKAILEGIDEIKDQNILQKAITLSILDLLIDIADDNDFSVSPTERTKVLTIARTLSRKHRREASILPWPCDERTES